MSAVILQFPHPKRAEAKAMIDRIEKSRGNEPSPEYPEDLMAKAIACLVEVAATRAHDMGHVCDRAGVANVTRLFLERDR